jgi:hypothetical protein
MALYASDKLGSERENGLGVPPPPSRQFLRKLRIKASNHLNFDNCNTENTKMAIFLRAKYLLLL